MTEATSTRADKETPALREFSDAWDESTLWKNLFGPSVITRSLRSANTVRSAQGGADDMSTSKGILRKVGGGRHTLTLHHKERTEEGTEEYEIDRKEEEEDEFTREESTKEAEQPPNLSATMDSIQALVLTVASLQLDYRLRQTGGERRTERPRRTQVQVDRNTGELEPCPGPPPNQQAIS